MRDGDSTKSQAGALGWEFPGWGSTTRIDDLGSGPVALTHLDSGLAHKLGQWRSTAICGNDITSSCLYVAALCSIYAGPYAPLALLIVAAVLYLFRNIYAEVGSALPLNGGAYNVLLNTTTKAKASMAACLTLLSYVATAVISANEAMHYAHNLWQSLDVFWATVATLGLFALLNLIGMSESANVALGIFIFHMATLVTLTVTCGLMMLGNGATFQMNWNTPTPRGAAMALFFGFSAALLGISGFESSANFIEEQQPGVFPKTLRNMWIAVAVFNPLMSFLAMGLIPFAEIGEHKVDLLAHMGFLSSGPWVEKMVSFDAVLVLSGAVLTSYVGVTGLVRRMSLDQCLPQFLLNENRLRHTNHWIIFLFFLICCSILLISGGQVELLAGVYTISFLGVMILFAVGNILLKVKRARLARDTIASWPAVTVGLLAVTIGLAGNLLMNPEYARVFGIYFGAVFAIVGIMFLRVQLLKLVLNVIRSIVANVRAISQKINQSIIESIGEINSRQVIYFSRGDNLEALNRAALYVLNNEVTNNLKVVHCFVKEEDIAANLADHLQTIDQMYPRIKIDLVLVHASSVRN